MPFPETVAQLVAAGYKEDNEADCRGCRRAITWFITPKGKRMPFDVDADGNCEPHFATCPNAREFRK